MTQQSMYPPEVKTKLVFSGSFEQFWHIFQNDKGAVHVKSTKDIVGRRNYEIVTIGTWYTNDRVVKLKDYAENYLTK